MNTIERLLYKFIRNKVLPVLTIVALFSVCLAIGGYLLQHTRVKEEAGFFARLGLPAQNRAGADSHKAHMTLRVLPDSRTSAVPVLAEGASLRLELSPASRAPVTLRATFVGFAETGRRDSWLLGIVEPGDTEKRLLKALEESSVTTNVTVTFRTKSLLTAALERTHLQ